MNGLDWSKTGLHIKGAYLNHLRFADDLVLLSETVYEMQSMISLYKSEYKQVKCTTAQPPRSDRSAARCGAFTLT
ncbi:hypothetical protein EVAR_89333_1 [Eumeta japonica]|uniref:Reverse transcriptase domain-containing protein n=1 Tax=Eumeta variegata TaxID=151549 RepID=A0A4C1Y2T5_EUMVA|nr:hypothetical protein EVAR_89333_1 [Eumeta japonica]